MSRTTLRIAVFAATVALAGPTAVVAHEAAVGTPASPRKP